MIVDVHTHHVPRELFDGLKGFSIQPNPGGDDLLLYAGNRRGHLSPRLTDTRLVMEDMDRFGIDVRVLVTASWLQGYWLPPEQGEAFCRRTNDLLAQTVATYPDRFVAIAAVPLQDPNHAIKELRRAVEELGLRGVAVGTSVNGHYYDEPRFFPFLEAVQELDVPIFFHPDDITGPERYGRYYTRLLLGNPHEAAMSLAYLIMGGVLERLPRLMPVVTMGGGTIAGITGRMDNGWRRRPETREKISRPPTEYLKQVYFDTICHSVDPLDIILRYTPPSHLVMGNDWPWDMGEEVPGTSVRALKGITEEERAGILGGNAARILKLSNVSRA